MKKNGKMREFWKIGKGPYRVPRWHGGYSIVTYRDNYNQMNSKIEKIKSCKSDGIFFFIIY